MNSKKATTNLKPNKVLLTLKVSRLKNGTASSLALINSYRNRVKKFLGGMLSGYCIS